MERRLFDTLQRARHVAVLTGAGMSAESGLPTFRESLTGLWSKYRPEDLATPEAFERDPGLVWDWYRMRREAALRAEPNAGHLALTRLGTLVPRLTLITQNVDGLHRRAGSRDVVELHGDITRARCSLEGGVVARWDEPAAGGAPPTCDMCGRISGPMSSGSGRRCRSGRCTAPGTGFTIARCSWRSGPRTWWSPPRRYPGSPPHREPSSGW